MPTKRDLENKTINDVVMYQTALQFTGNSNNGTHKVFLILIWLFIKLFSSKILSVSYIWDHYKLPLDYILNIIYLKKNGIVVVEGMWTFNKSFLLSLLLNMPLLVKSRKMPKNIF